MNKANNGGPAFPLLMGAETTAGCEGMTLGDYFAAKWLQGFMANPQTPDIDWRDAASAAYKMADAMLNERKVQP